MIYQDSDFRLFPSDSKPSEGNEYSRKDGWVEVVRIKASINPKQSGSDKEECLATAKRELFQSTRVDNRKIFKISATVC